jgi:hypothetical protein
VAAPPLDLHSDGPVTYPGDIKTLRIRSKGRSGPTLKYKSYSADNYLLTILNIPFSLSMGI